MEGKKEGRRKGREWERRKGRKEGGREKDEGEGKEEGEREQEYSIIFQVSDLDHELMNELVWRKRLSAGLKEKATFNTGEKKKNQLCASGFAPQSHAN